MSEIKEARDPGMRHFKFSDSFFAGFKALISAYDKKIEELHNISSLIDKDAHHGVCNCSYKMRYITPENVSTFISNIEKAMANKLLKPKMGDCDLFAVSSVKKFLDGNGCVPFDAFSLMGNPGADIPKGATLADLTFAAESEVFNVIVYSKYELEQRAKDIKDDIKKMQDMHFSAAIKAFVDKLPGIMDSKANYVMNDSLIYVAMERYIEDFIMFALRLNYTTICQMIGYAVPRVAYKIEPESDDSNESANNADNWDEDNEFFKQEEFIESNDSDECYCEGFISKKIDVNLLKSSANLIGKFLQRERYWKYTNETRNTNGALPENVKNALFDLVDNILSSRNFATYDKNRKLLCGILGMPTDCVIDGTGLTHMNQGDLLVIMKTPETGTLENNGSVKLYHTSKKQNIDKLIPTFMSAKTVGRGNVVFKKFEALYPTPRIYFGYNAPCSRMGGTPTKTVDNNTFVYMAAENAVNGRPIKKDTELQGGNACFIETTTPIPVTDVTSEFRKGSAVQEAVDSTKVSPVFFIFTQGKGLIPAAIKTATDSEYSHVSISFDASLDHMYSFGTTGFRVESIHDEKRKDRDICVYGTFVSKDGVKKMKDICHDFEEHIDDSKFNYSSLIKKLFGNDSPKESEYKEICSTFVNKCLNEVNQPLTDKAIPSSKEMMEDAGSRADQVFQLFEGNSKDYKKGPASKTLKRMGKKEKTKRYDEYVTECCGFIKSNDYIITNKIPFNCNVRDIVLQDVHPTFKDTISALKFIMNDERSPIHQLVIQYFTEPIEDYDPSMVVKMFMGCCHKDLFDPMFAPSDMGAYEKLKNSAASMNTDVNWLDKITYGNMFYDGNYRRDALGNNKVRPIMNSFETIYKMFGGCDNETDNTCLANNMIRISRVMKAIIGKYEEGCICDWEMCRDILAVFGEIFTRNMLRLYYNNSSHVLTSDQMEDAMGPGYMYHESFVQEASDMKHNDANQDTQGVGKVAKVGLRKILEAMAKWVRTTLSTFLPNFFKNNLQHQCEWVEKNATNKYNEIMKAANAGENGYKFPIKAKIYTFNVTFNPSEVKAKEILSKYMNDENANLDDQNTKTEIKKELMSMFGDNNGKVAEMAKLDGEELQKAFVNMVLYGNTQPTPPDESNRAIKPEEFTQYYQDLLVLSKGNGVELSKRFTDMSKSLGDGIDELKNNVKEQAQNNAGGENKTDPAADAKNKRIDQLNNIVSEVSKCCYVASANAVVKQLYPEIYNTFKGVVDDFDTMKNKGVAPAQQNATNTPPAAGQNAQDQAG